MDFPQPGQPIVVNGVVQEMPYGAVAGPTFTGAHSAFQLDQVPEAKKRRKPHKVGPSSVGSALVQQMIQLSSVPGTRRPRCSPNRR